MWREKMYHKQRRQYAPPRAQARLAHNGHDARMGLKDNHHWACYATWQCQDGSQLEGHPLWLWLNEGMDELMVSDLDMRKAPGEGSRTGQWRSTDANDGKLSSSLLTVSMGAKKKKEKFTCFFLNHLLNTTVECRGTRFCHTKGIEKPAS